MFDADDPLQLYDCNSFGKLPPPEVPWVWDGYLARGSLSLLTSRWKAGKTTLLSVLLFRLTAGGTLAGAAVTPGRAIILSEEPPSLWHDRHLRLGYGPNIQWSSRPFKGRPTREQWLTLMASLAARKPDLVVLDPLAMFLPGCVENNAAALLDALEPLHLLTDAGIAVLLIHHPRKGQPGQEFSPRGSGALTGFVDIVIDLERSSAVEHSERVRRLKVSSRLRDCFRRHVELMPDGKDYVVLPEPVDGEGFAAGWPVLEIVLEDSDSKCTRKDILASWPPDYVKPSSSTLVRWLETALTEGLIERCGIGRRHDPFRYCVKGQMFMMEDLPPLEPLHYENRFTRPKSLDRGKKPPVVPK